MSADVDSADGSTMLKQFLARLVSDETPAEVVEAVAALDRASRLEPSSAGPFLSVIVRTQGTRLDALNQALASLEAQSNDDFEVILIVHADGDSARERVRGLLEGHTERLAQRIHLESLAGGGRSDPLNLGVQRARGRYIAVFDDDDLLLADWVEAFARSEAAAAGRLMRARVGTQDVRIDGATEAAPIVTVSEIRDDYPPGFDTFRHFQRNASPFMGWAFPRALFTRLGVRFRSNLDLLEDWDLVLRGASLLGVHQIDELTAVYRRWSTGDSSVATSSGEGWELAEASLIDALDEVPVLLDVGSVRRIRRLLADSDELFAIKLSRSWRLAQAIARMANGLRRILPRLGRRDT